MDGGKPLRIALLTWESLHTIAVGGVAPHVTELAAGLERRGHEVHVYSRTGDGQMPYEIIDGVHIHRVPIALDPGESFGYALPCHAGHENLCGRRAPQAPAATSLCVPPHAEIHGRLHHRVRQHVQLLLLVPL